MPNLPEEIETRADLTVFYVLDTSGSMVNEKIATLNAAMVETVEALKDAAKHNGDAHIRIAILEFNSGCNWITYNGPEYMEDFTYTDLKAGGLTDMGMALEELDKKLHRSEYLNAVVGSKLPIIIFMTDGYATDDYRKGLEKIKQNKWFKYATKIGFAIGEEPDSKMLAERVGNSEAVIKTDDLDLFSRLLKFVTVTSSKLQSQTKNDMKDIVTGEDIIHQAEEEGMITKEDVADDDVPVSEPEEPAKNDSDDEDSAWDFDDWE